MTRAACHFDHNSEHRRALFEPGLRAAGFDVTRTIANPAKGDVLVVWNRTGSSHTIARQFEGVGGRVVVCENAYMGAHWMGEKWCAMALYHHNGAGKWSNGGPERWDSWGITLAPWRKPGGECVILAQRGIGEQGLRAPDGWLNLAVSTTRGRIRRHPGLNKALSLEEDLHRASSVATWSSGAAIKALMLGVPAFYGMPHWIGSPCSQLLSGFKAGPICNDELRLKMFRRLAWAQWSSTEIMDGTAFKSLLWVK